MALKSSLVRRLPNVPANTLSYLENDDALIKTVTEREHKSQKSVHFASEVESLSDSESVDSLQTSKDVISWLPSEHLYSDDTFVSESENPTTVVPTDPSYGSSTFIDLDSEDETKTESDYSYTESFASSGVFSPTSPTDTTSTYREITEIVKDIEELEESEFLTRADSLQLDDEDELTDIFESSEDEEMVEMARQNFLLNTIRRLKLRDLQSPRSLALDSPSHSYSDQPHMTPVKDPHEKEKQEFYKHMIDSCDRANSKPLTKGTTSCNPLYEKAGASKTQVLEHYGLSSVLVDKLKLENLQHRLRKKAEDLDKSTQKSLDYLERNQHIEAEWQKQQFLSQMQAHVQNEKTEERIQDHLIKMHPVKCFAEFINQLPSFADDSREILYKYRRQIERRMEEQEDG